MGSERHDPTVTLEKLTGSWEGLQGFFCKITVEDPLRPLSIRSAEP